MIKNWVSFLPSLILLIFVSCGFPAAPSDERATADEQSVSVSCWNAQTFFDAENHGTEYSEFQSLSKWSKEKYMVRLQRLCQVMTTLDPQVMILEEIENAAVVQDIANQLAGNSWDNKQNWTYACFGREKGAAIGCAVFSKLPLKDFKIHSMYIKSLKKEQPAGRPVLEVTVEAGGKELVIFVNHWKSKSGGEVQSEIWRDWQENLLAQRVEQVKMENGNCCLLCGDFNRDAKDFVCRFGKGRENVLLRWGEAGGGGKQLFVVCPWFTEAGNYILNTGSYFYKKSWERIDNIFLTGPGKITSFKPRAQSPWADSASVPEAYVLYSGSGFSDHLPLTCTVILE